MSELVNYIPEISMAAGYAVGQGLEQIGLNKIAHDRRPLFPGYQPDDPDAGKSLIPTPWYRRGLQRATASLALVGAFAGLAAGEALKPGQEIADQPDGLVVAVDHNLATAQNKAAQKANQITSALAENKNLKLQIVVAHNTGSEDVSLKELEADKPLGAPSVKYAVPDAIKEAGSPDLANGQTGKRADVLVITDGNAMGYPSKVIKQAQAKGIRIHVANLDKSSDEVDNLTKVVKGTDGQYFDSNTSSKDVEAIVQSVTRAVANEEIKTDNPGENRLPWSVMAAGLGGTALIMFARRKKQSVVS